MLSRKPGPPSKRRRGRSKRLQSAKQRVECAIHDKNPNNATPTDILASVEIEDRLDAAELEIGRQKGVLQALQSKSDLLEKFTRDRITKELQSAVQKAESDELAKKQAVEIEHARLKKLQSQIEKHKLFAPSEGTVVYCNEPRGGAKNRETIEEGAKVRERQLDFRNSRSECPNERERQDPGIESGPVEIGASAPESMSMPSPVNRWRPPSVSCIRCRTPTTG